MNLRAIQSYLIKRNLVVLLSSFQYSNRFFRIRNINLKHLTAHLRSLELAYGIKSHQSSGTDKAHALTQLCFVHIMSRYQHRDAFFRHLVNQFPELASADWINSGCWFIQKNNFRMMNNGAAQCKSLFPSAG